MTTLPISQFLVASIALAVPLGFLLGALLGSRRAPFRAAMIAASVAVVHAGIVGAAVAVAARPPTLGVRLDLVTGVMLLLVAMIGLVIVRFSRTYLEGDPGAPRYARWLLATLAAVTALVIANNLLVMALACTAASVALHQLLTFYDRPAALVAAHKKFLISRVADVCMWAAIVLVNRAVGSLELDAVYAWVGAHEALPLSLHLAAGLFVAAACLNSAQLPFHGWLTQVMEAPTPVSALLHAGVINIGGFLMIRLAPLMAHAPGAQLLLVTVGMVTTVVAALVMTTRVSIKVSLAWSTCAQMGFMLVQCGLGAWHLALLHLVAHSFYKAHAFLSSGSTVDVWRVQSLSRRPPPATAVRLAATTAAALVLVGAGVRAVTAVPALSVEFNVPLVVLALVVALSLVPMLARGALGGGMAALRVGMQALGVTVLYFGWHTVAGRLLVLPSALPLIDAGWLIVTAGFLLLFFVQSVLQVHPEGRLARALHPILFAGLYLDERFTRLTFRMWPPRLRSPTAQPRLTTLESTGA